MFQPDLFTPEIAADLIGPRLGSEPLPACPPRRISADAELDLPAVLETIAGISPRPRYTFMVLNLIARAAGEGHGAGPYVLEDGQTIAIRDWLSDALMPMAQRNARRVEIVRQVRDELARSGTLPSDQEQADVVVADLVRVRLRHSGRTNVSRAVSDLVRAGLVQRRYQGYRVDHENRGAQREAVYTIPPRVKRALGKSR